MAKRTKGAPLTEAFIRRAGVGIHGDGRGSRGLSLRVHRTANGRLSHSWRQAVVLDGKRTALGLGKWPEVPLKEARVNAMGNAVTIARGGDPRRAPLAKTAKAKTFADAAESLIPFAARWMASRHVAVVDYYATQTRLAETWKKSGGRDHGAGRQAPTQTALDGHASGGKGGAYAVRRRNFARRGARLARGKSFRGRGGGNATASNAARRPRRHAAAKPAAYMRECGGIRAFLFGACSVRVQCDSVRHWFVRTYSIGPEPPRLYIMVITRRGVKF